MASSDEPKSGSAGSAAPEQPTKATATPVEPLPPTTGVTDSQPPVFPEAPEGSLLWRLLGLVRQMRPEQWVKNLFVLAPWVFSKQMTHETIVMSALGAFGVFCALASSIYTINDLVDIEADRIHPRKRKRPLASGRVPVWAGKVLAVVLLAIALGGASLGPPQFLATVLGYFFLQIAYTFRLKKIAYVDVGCIAAGFVLRVLAGSYAVRVTPSFYLIACTALLALFLGFGKRRHELAGANAAKQRAALEQYSPRVLTIALALTGVLTIASYLAYTLDPATRHFFKSNWLWVTTIHPLFGVIRFVQLVATRPKAESPTQEMLRDVPFMMNLVLYAVEVLFIVYQLRPT
ncbi:MAG: decaprenyl-phosphate phosphoribosyltransferase [Polyangiaceae bacterium]|nr:decaprenyl-phosphate phosphoribosyltransferase [Polyangiaceae bacterium]